jgi:predicted O-linked N-acetylglucosamine transferase (SPINDLY family)
MKPARNPKSKSAAATPQPGQALTLPQAMQQAQLAYQNSDLATAEHLCRLVLGADPAYADALNLLAIMAAQTGHLATAAELMEQLARALPHHPMVHSNYGHILLDLGRHEQALAHMDQAIALQPQVASTHTSRATILRALRRADEALASYAQALALQPGNPEIHLCMGMVQHELQRWDAALACYEQALALHPGYAEAHVNCGLLLQDQQQLEAALACYDRAIALQATCLEAHINRGSALQKLGRLQEAVASFAQALALQPERPEAHNNMGVALYELKRLDEALACYNRAIALKPDFFRAYSNRGVTLHWLKQLDAAVASYDQAIALKPDYAEAYVNRGDTQQALRQFSASLDSYKTAIQIQPDYEFLFGAILHTRMHLCDWQDLDANIQKLTDRIVGGEKVSRSLSVIALVDSPRLHQLTVELLVKEKYPPTTALPAEFPKVRKPKIKIGYYSADFHNHATAYLIAELFESHDRSAFELIGFSFGPDIEDEMRLRLRAAFDQFIDVRALDDLQVAQLSRDMGIDIAVDLKGYTQDMRIGIFAHRCAPVQVNYLGYPGTMGASYMDYIMADGMVIPAGSEPYYTEKVVRLPHSYQINDSQRKISDRQFTRTELGLPEQGFVFCCFNKNYKILPQTFDGWMRILKQVEGSVLWLFQETPTSTHNLQQEAEKRGIDSRRLIFAPHMNLADHLARHRLADLFIDTLPCNAHTTASDALWAGLPVLTCIGQAFASRVAGSLLQAIGLPELITHTQAEYEARAIALATQPDQLAAVRAKLHHNRLRTPLFDIKLYTQHIEAAYRAMHERYLSNQAPEHISVA